MIQKRPRQKYANAGQMNFLNVKKAKYTEKISNIIQAIVPIISQICSVLLLPFPKFRFDIIMRNVPPQETRNTQESERSTSKVLFKSDICLKIEK